MSRLSPLPHSRSKSSLLSATTYHSFHDVELYESAKYLSETGGTTTPETTPQQQNVEEQQQQQQQQQLLHEEFEATEMRRQDSGYESIPSNSNSSAKRRTSTISSSNSNSALRLRGRPSVRRSAKSGPVAHLPRTTALALYPTRSHSSYRQHHPNQPPVAYFHFPAPPEPQHSHQHQHQHPWESEPRQSLGTHVVRPSFDGEYGGGRGARQFGRSETSPPASPPPQTTHYWTSDRTRRLEYAAIDAASRGVRGWVMRHMVPECFVPRERRHIGFDDDGGSVRRYRLDLDEDDVALSRRGGGGGGGGSGGEKEGGNFSGTATGSSKWRFWGSGC